MRRWTIRELNTLDDFAFAINVLNERASRLDYFAPMNIKIRQTVATLTQAKELCKDKINMQERIL